FLLAPYGKPENKYEMSETIDAAASEQERRGRRRRDALFSAYSRRTSGGAAFIKVPKGTFSLPFSLLLTSATSPPPPPPAFSRNSFAMSCHWRRCCRARRMRTAKSRTALCIAEGG